MHTSKKRRGGLENNKLVGLLSFFFLILPCVCFLWQVYNSRQRHVQIYCSSICTLGGLGQRTTGLTERIEKGPTAYPWPVCYSLEIIGALLYCPAFLFYFFPFSTFFSLDPGDKDEDFFFLFAQQEKKRRNSARALLNFKIKTYRKLLRIGRERS
jgi:hypothetical protein